MSALDELLQRIGLGLGSSGPDFNAMSLDAETINQGREAMLGTMNEAALLRDPNLESLLADLNSTPEALADPLPQASYSNEGRVTSANIRTALIDGSATMPEDPLQGWQEVDKGVFKKKDAKGQSQYTNVRTAEGTPTMQPFTPGQQVQSPSNQLLGANLASRMQTLQDPTLSGRARMEMAQQLQVDAAAEKAKILEGINKQARIALKVPQLEALVAQQELLDQAHPSYKPGVGDSKETAQVRARLHQALSGVDNEVARLAQTNVKLNTLTAQTNAALKLAEYDMKQADKIADREDRQREIAGNIKASKELTAENQRLAREDRDRQTRERIMATVSSEGLERLRLIQPALADKTDEEAAMFLAGGKKNISEADFAAIQAQPEDLLDLAMTGNAGALKVLGAKEGAPEQVRKDIGGLVAMKDPLILKGAVLEMVGGNVKDPTYKGVETLTTKKASGTLSKQELVQYDEIAKSTAIQYLRQKQQKAWESDMSTWAVPPGTVSTAVEQVKDAGIKPSVDQVAKVMVAGASPKDRAQIMEDLKSIIFANAAPTKNSLLYAKDPNAAWQKAQLEATKSRFSTVVGGLSAPLVTPLGALSAPLVAPVTNAVGDAWNYLFGAQPLK